MELFGGSDNKGFCDCVEYPPAIYSDETGECSFQNTQGSEGAKPSLYFDWIVFKLKNI
jgi:hypothetical protein